MWSRKIVSGDKLHLTPKDVFVLLLSRLVEKRIHCSWAHFEVVTEGSSFTILPKSKHWVEVGNGEASFELNIGAAKSKKALLPEIPGKWPAQKGTWLVPIEDSDELVQWIDKHLAAISGRSDYQVTGWLDGL